MDEADKAQQEVDRQLATTITNREAVRDIKLAQPSADNCSDCGVDIPAERKLAVPGCQRCISCKEKFEILQRRTKNA